MFFDNFYIVMPTRYWYFSPVNLKPKINFCAQAGFFRLLILLARTWDYAENCSKITSQPKKKYCKNVFAAILSSYFPLMRACQSANWFLDVSQDNCRSEDEENPNLTGRGRNTEDAENCSAQSWKLKLEFLEKIRIVSMDLGRIWNTLDNY